MNRIPVDAELRTKLFGLKNEAEVCDESGKTLGHFFPEAVYRRMLYAWANSQISNDELAARLNAPGGESLADVWARLDAK